MPTLAELAIGDPDFSILVELVVAADANTGSNFAAALAGPDTLSILAPTNAAWLGLAQSIGYAGALDGVTDFLLTALATDGDPYDVLVEILSYHIIDGLLLPGTTTTGTATSISGETITFTAGGIIDADLETSNASTPGTATIATNGEAFSIDQVLLPENYDFNSNPGIELRGDRKSNTLTGTEGYDELSGEGGHDIINGLGGADKIRGGNGKDTIDGGTGNDDINGGKGNDLIFGGEGDDRLRGGQKEDILHGGDGDDDLRGGSGNDIINGDDGDDRIVGDGNNDILDGGAGNDNMHGGDGMDVMTGDTGNDKMFGDSGNDIMNGGDDDDIIDGGSGSDDLRGGSGNDTLFGGGQGDRLVGGSGDDVMDGGFSNDLLTGNTGADTFVMTSSGNNDTITDFGNGDDKMDLTDFAGLDFTTVMSTAIEVAGDTTLYFGNGATFTLEDVAIADLTSDDFIFAEPIIEIG